MRIAWVVPRFGADVLGGAEALVRALAQRVGGPGDEMEVLTTCAVDHTTWANVLAPGASAEDGLTVRRFAVADREPGSYAALHARVASGRARYADELEWLSLGVWSPGLEAFVEARGREYDLIVAAPYWAGTSVWSAPLWPDRTVLMPCLHDEPYAYLDTIRGLVRGVRGCFFNTAAEQALARRLYGEVRGAVVGVGFDPPSTVAGGFAERRGLAPYLLYAGRIEEGKRVDVLVEYAVRYAAEREHAPRLVLAGRGTYRPASDAGRVVVEVGFLSPDERRAAYADALALVNPSQLESLSLIVLEAWLERTPVLGAAGSPVLRDHVERSGGGFLFAGYEEFAHAVDSLRDDALRSRLGANGAAYVLDEYGWPAVRERFAKAVAQLLA